MESHGLDELGLAKQIGGFASWNARAMFPRKSKKAKDDYMQRLLRSKGILIMQEVHAPPETVLMRMERLAPTHYTQSYPVVDED
eukprot:11726405-Karenia_brevis.AAC.1